MVVIFGEITLLLATAGIPGNVNAMDSMGHCNVAAGEKLPPQSGGAELLCSEVEGAIAAAAPNVAYQAHIQVISPSRLAAVLAVNGRRLPKQKFAIMDRELNRGAIERFAQALAIEVAKAAKP